MATERQRQLSERHSERLRALRVSTERLRAHNDDLEAKLASDMTRVRVLVRKGEGT